MFFDEDAVDADNHALLDDHGGIGLANLFLLIMFLVVLHY